MFVFLLERSCSDGKPLLQREDSKLMDGRIVLKAASGYLKVNLLSHDYFIKPGLNIMKN
jgi:hypothetical protein